jgi:hypothetical protein
MAYFTLTQDFLDEVITSLGGTLVDVELTNDDYQLCFGGDCADALSARTCAKCRAT